MQIEWLGTMSIIFLILKFSRLIHVCTLLVYEKITFLFRLICKFIISGFYTGLDTAIYSQGKPNNQNKEN